MFSPLHPVPCSLHMCKSHRIHLCWEGWINQTSSPLGISHTGSPEIHPAEFYVSSCLAGPPDSPDAKQTLFSGSSYPHWDLGTGWSQTTPLQRDSRGSPRPGRGSLDGALRSEDERTASGHCPWPLVQFGRGGERAPCPFCPRDGAAALLGEALAGAGTLSALRSCRPERWVPQGWDSGGVGSQRSHPLGSASPPPGQRPDSPALVPCVVSG